MRDCFELGRYYENLEGLREDASYELMLRSFEMSVQELGIEA